MSKRAEERALEAYPPDKRKAFELLPKDWNKPLRTAYVKGYEQAEEDLANAAAFSGGPDGFYYGKGYQQGKKDAEKHLSWHSVEESLPPVDEEVIVLTQVPAFGRISFAHLVNSDVMITIDGKPYKPEAYSGWNIPGVKYWMPMPKIPEV